jgi:hypothetical protein
LNEEKNNRKMQAAGVGMVESQKFSLVLILSRWQKYRELSEGRQTDQAY